MIYVPNSMKPAATIHWCMSNSLQPHEQAPLFMGFSRQEYWRGLPFSSPGDLPDPGIEPSSPTLQADSLPSEPPEKPPFNEGGTLKGEQGIKDF